MGGAFWLGSFSYQCSENPTTIVESRFMLAVGRKKSRSKHDALALCAPHPASNHHNIRRFLPKTGKASNVVMVFLPLDRVESLSCTRRCADPWAGE